MQTQLKTPEITGAIREAAQAQGFEAVGCTPLRESDHERLYREWLDRGLHGTMDYLEREDAVEARLRPERRWSEMRSAVVVAHHYVQGDGGDEGVEPDRGVVARYARGRDYHKVVKKKLLALLRDVESLLGRELPESRAYVDTGPILERELAQRAGIGWHGRNTMMIDPRRGSYFFIGSLLLPVELEYDEPFGADRCGTCSACVDACPTGALLGRDENGAPVMDATRCISYLTIENRGEIPEELRPAIGNRIYGCDICQAVCPWNSPNLVQITGERDYRSDWWQAQDRPERPTDLPSTESPSLMALMRMTREEWDLWTRGSALRRAGYTGFKRNVAVAIGNWLATLDEPPDEAVGVLEAALEDKEALVREHADWALRQVRRP